MLKSKGKSHLRYFELYSLGLRNRHIEQILQKRPHHRRVRSELGTRKLLDRSFNVLMNGRTSVCFTA